METDPREDGRAHVETAPEAREPAGPPDLSGAGGSGKGVLGFFAVVMLLYALPGIGAQSISAPLGLAWSEIFVFLLPAWAAAAGSNLRPRRFLLLERRPTFAQVSLGLLCGAAAFPVAEGLMALWSAALPERWVRAFDLSGLFEGPPLERAVIALLASLLAPACEEIAFRGYVQGALLTRRTPAAAIGLGALLFALMHLDPVRFPAVLGLGAFFGWLAWRAGSLWPAIAAHAVNNGIASAAVLATEVEPVPSAPALRQAVLLAAAGAGALALVVALYRRATPSPPAPAALDARRDPADPSVRFRWQKVPAPLLAAAALGFALLLVLAVLGRSPATGH